MAGQKTSVAGQKTCVAGQKTCVAGQKTSVLSHKSIVVWFLGMTICYQVVFQGIMWTTISNEAAEEECTTLGSDLSTSPQCREVHLFRTWQQAESQDQPAMESAAQGQEHLIKAAMPVTHIGEQVADTSAGLASLLEDSSTVPRGSSNASVPGAKHPAGHLDEGASLGAVAAVVKAASAPAGPATGAAGAASSADQAGGAAGESVSTSSHLDDWARDFSALQQRLQAQTVAVPSKLQEHLHDRDAQLDILLAAGDASLNAASNITPWAAELIDLQQRLEASRTNRTNTHHTTATRSSAAAVPLLESIYRLGREMCMEPRRHGWPECARFLSGPRPGEGRETDAEKQARRAAKAAWRTRNAEDLESRLAELDGRLEEMEASRKVWEAALVDQAKREVGILAGDVKASTQRKALRKQYKKMHWMSVKRWRDQSRWSGSSSLLSIAREDLDDARWVGMIPSVACVAAFSSSIHTAPQLDYLINSFKFQDYEGRRQLVLVYHHADHAAMRLLRQWVDGMIVKAVASRDDAAFPSTKALRYAVWSSHADVIAHWDLRQRHHPQRIAMQVHALALYSRPACVLKKHMWEEPTVAGSKPRDLSLELGLVGENSWMQENWHPLADTKHNNILEGAESRHIIELDVSSLHHPVRTPTTLPVGGVSGAANQTVISGGRACLNVSSETWAGDRIQERIADQAGKDLADHYRSLVAKRQDITQKLRFLCGELQVETDPSVRAHKGADADRMLSIIVEFDKHFDSLGKLFELPGTR